MSKSIISGIISHYPFWTRCNIINFCTNYPKLTKLSLCISFYGNLKDLISFYVMCNVLYFQYRNKIMERQPKPNHTVGWRTEWQLGCCCVAWNFIRKTQPANALMFLSVFKGCLECHQSSRQIWKHWKKIRQRDTLKWKRGKLKGLQTSWKESFQRLFYSLTEHNINCLCLLSGDNKMGGKVHWKKQEPTYG